MRSMRPGLTWLSGAGWALAVAAGTAGAQEAAPSGDRYPSTLHFGTGLINTPVAWIAPRSAEVFIQTSGKTIPSFPDKSKQSLPSLFNTNISIDTHWWNRVSLGVSAYSQNPEWGFFGQALLLKDNQFAFLPALAVGFRNLGPYNREERFLIGHDTCLQGSTYNECVPGYFDGFKSSPTLYGVLTKGFALSNVMGRLPAAMMSLSVGMGNGIFKDDGGLGKSYNRRGTIADGLFLGTRVTMHPSLNTRVTILAENDGWDYNAGVVLDWRGVTLGLYGTELEEGGRDSTKNTEGPLANNLIYNYTKFNISLGYSGNIKDIARGVVLRTRITELTREQERLRLEVAARERRIARLEEQLRRAQAGELADIDRRRRELDEQVQGEREEIRKATERLRELERNQPTPPPSTPPPSTPSSSSTTTPAQ